MDLLTLPILVPENHRNPYGVMYAITQAIPASEPVLGELIPKFNEIITKATFRAPEVQSITWREMESVLVELLGSINKPWVDNVKKIMTNVHVVNKIA